MISWLNHSRRTPRSPNIFSKCGPSDSMSMSVSLTSNTSTDGRLGIRMATFLNGPRVAVGIGEVREARIVGSLGIGPEAETPLPLSAVDVLVPDGADANASVDELVSNRRDVCHHEIKALNETGRRVGEPDAELYRSARPGRGELYDAEVLGRGVVDVEDESESVPVEVQRLVRIGHRQNDNFERGDHGALRAVF